MRDAFIARLYGLCADDPRLYLITGDLGFSVLDGFIADYPQQFLNAGVAEQNMTAVGAGLALEGRIVFTYSIANFPVMRCFEHLRNDVCYHDANLKVVAVGGGFSYGQLGFSHHATEDLAITRALPKMTVVSPGCRWEASEATEALVNRPGPAYLRLDKGGPKENTNRPGEQFVLGKARVLREGDAMTLISTGGVLDDVLAAADQLAAQGLPCRVLSMHTIKPLDEEAVLDAARSTGGIVTIEEHNVIGGLGGAVAETCLEGGVPPRAFTRLGLKDVYSTIVGSQKYLRSHYGMDAPAIVAAVHRLLKRDSR